MKSVAGATVADALVDRFADCGLRAFRARLLAMNDPVSIRLNDLLIKRRSSSVVALIVIGIRRLAIIIRSGRMAGPCRLPTITHESWTKMLKIRDTATCRVSVTTRSPVGFRPTDFASLDAPTR